MGGDDDDTVEFSFRIFLFLDCVYKKSRLTLLHAARVELIQKALSLLVLINLALFCSLSLGQFHFIYQHVLVPKCDAMAMTMMNTQKNHKTDAEPAGTEAGKK